MYDQNENNYKHHLDNGPPGKCCNKQKRFIENLSTVTFSLNYVQNLLNFEVPITSKKIISQLSLHFPQ